MTKITVKEIAIPQVKFNSFLGYGVGVWKDNIEPKINHEYEIEFDIDELFEWGKNLNTSLDQSIKIDLNHNKLIFYAKVISYEDDDNILAVSLGDEIVFLEIINFKKDVTDYVSFSVSIENVLIYPIKL